MELMPDNILLEIFANLNRESLCLGARLTCTRWRSLTFDKTLWTHVTIPNHFTDARMLCLLEQIHESIEELETSNTNCLTADGFKSMARLSFPNLRKLAVPISTLLPEEVYAELAKSCPNLKEVENIRTGYMSEFNPLIGQKHWQNLTVVHDRPCSSYGRMRSPPRVSDVAKKQKWMTSLAEVSPDPNEITSYRCNRGLRYVDSEGLGKISKTFPKLTSIELNTCSVTDDGIGSFVQRNQALGSLKEITFDKPGQVSDKGLKFIADACPELEYLKIARCSNITNKGIRYLVNKCRKLSNLGLNNSPGFYDGDDPEDATRKDDIDDETLFDIGQCLQKLTFLWIYYTDAITHKGVDFITSGCSFLHGIMFFQCNSVGDKALTCLQECRFLKNVIIVYCEQISPRGLIEFVLLAPALNRLTFYTKNWDFCGDMSCLAEDTYGRIDLAEENFRPNQIHKVALRGVGAQFLQLLSVLCPNLLTLDMRESKFITEFSMISVLKNCEVLENLDISSMEDATDSFLNALCTHAPSLRVLTLGTSVKTMSCKALVNVIKSCVSLKTIEMDISEADIHAEDLVNAAEKYHGGFCYLYVENSDHDDEVTDNQSVSSRADQRYIELHFTPIKYLGSISAINQSEILPSD